MPIIHWLVCFLVNQPTYYIYVQKQFFNVGKNIDKFNEKRKKKLL